MEELAKNDEYVKSELVALRKRFGTKGHTLQEWKGWVNGLSFMYVHCNETMRVAVQAHLEETIWRQSYIFGLASIAD